MFRPNIFILSEKDIYKKIKSSLLKTIEEHATRAAQELDIDWPVNFTVYPNPAFTLKETGEGGYTPTKDWVQLSIDITEERVPANQVVENLCPTIYHEINHCKRWTLTGYGLTLEEAMVTEGLASVFEENMWTRSKAPWLVYTEDELQQMLKLLRARDKTSPYVHSDWFYGTNPEISRWLGYKVGHAIVKSAIAKNPQFSFNELMKKSGADILSLSGIEV